MMNNINIRNYETSNIKDSIGNGSEEHLPGDSLDLWSLATNGTRELKERAADSGRRALYGGRLSVPAKREAA